MIWVVWGCKCTIELKKVWFEGAKIYLRARGSFEFKMLWCEWIKDAKAYMRPSGLIWMDWGYKGRFKSKRVYFSAKGCDLSGLNVQQEQEASFEFKRTWLDWIKVQMHILERKERHGLDWGSKGTLENKKALFEWIEVQGHIWK